MKAFRLLKQRSGWYAIEVDIGKYVETVSLEELLLNGEAVVYARDIGDAAQILDLKEEDINVVEPEDY